MTATILTRGAAAWSADEATTPAGPEPAYVLQEAQPLSRSLLWDLQRRYFEGTGVAAWSEGIVPMYVTSNPFIARTYARVVDAFSARLAERRSRPSIGTQPFYIVELGAGSGRFAFHFLKQYLDLAGEPTAGKPAICYVMTEYNPALLDFWQTHPALRPFVDAGQLDFALFDAAQPAAPVLRQSGSPCPGPGRQSPRAPGQLFLRQHPPGCVLRPGRPSAREPRVAGLHALSCEAPAGPDPFECLRLVYERRPALCGAPFPLSIAMSALDALLEDYRRQLTDSALAFPIAGLRCLDVFRRLSAAGCCLLTSDKGYHRPEDLAGRHEPGFEAHGSFSVSVNYHAIDRYFHYFGGRTLSLPHRHIYLDTCAFLLGEPPSGCLGVDRAFADAIARFGPEDFFMVQASLETGRDQFSVEQVLAYLRLGAWDAGILRKCFARLFATLPSASPVLQHEIRHALQHVWDGYYHIGEEYDLPYDLAILCYKMGDYTTAMAYFEHSIDLYGPGAKTLYNLSLCYYCLQNPAAALANVVEAERLDPAFEPAHTLRAKLERERQR